MNPSDTISEAMVEAAMVASRDKRLNTLTNSNAMRFILEAALSVQVTGGAEGGLVQCGWAYQDKRWDANHWHVCGFDNKPREHDGRIVRPIYVPAALASSGGGR